MTSMEAKHTMHLPALRAGGIGLRVRLDAGRVKECRKLNLIYKCWSKNDLPQKEVFTVQEMLRMPLQGSNVDDSFDVEIELGSMRRDRQTDRPRETVWGPAHGGAGSTSEESPDQRLWNDVRWIQIVKQNSPRAGGFSLSISPSSTEF